MRYNRRASAKNKKGKTQSQRFIEAARQFEADDDKEAFRRKLEQIAKPKEPPNP
jgi:hypothetical protein